MRVMEPERSDAVRVEVPAQTINMSIVRTVAAAVAARAELTVDQIEDVRLATDEAMSYLIAHAGADASVSCLLTVGGADFHAEMSCATTASELPEPEPFSWTVLTALVGSVETDLQGGRLTMSLSVTRDHSVSA
ncbi:MAG TPA: ATP-binding protein [Candidatus Nanopelagicales bacterium]|nr:ATP-binding protein [Candidatus Nanopelagicales bacterium]